jgi:hypothetical protein
MIPRHVYNKLFTLNFLDKVTGKGGLNQTERRGLISYQMVPRQEKALEPDFLVTDQGGNLALALGGIQRYSRQKYMPLRHAQFRI